MENFSQLELILFGMIILSSMIIFWLGALIAKKNFFRILMSIFSFKEGFNFLIYLMLPFIVYTGDIYRSILIIVLWFFINSIFILGALISKYIEENKSDTNSSEGITAS